MPGRDDARSSSFLNSCASSVARPKSRMPRDSSVSHVCSRLGWPVPPSVVDHRVAVVDLEQLVVAHRRQVVGGDRPAEIRMVDVRHAAGHADGVDVVLQHLGDAACRPARAWTRPIGIEGVDVQRLALEAGRHFLALDHQELVVGAVQGIEAVDRGQVVVVGEHQEVVLVVPVPADDVVRRAVAVAVQRVRVRVALEPAERTGGWCRWRRLTGDDRVQSGTQQRGREEQAARLHRPRAYLRR